MPGTRNNQYDLSDDENNQNQENPLQEVINAKKDAIHENSSSEEELNSGPEDNSDEQQPKQGDEQGQNLDPPQQSTPKLPASPKKKPKAKTSKKTSKKLAEETKYNKVKNRTKS